MAEAPSSISRLSCAVTARTPSPGRWNGEYARMEGPRDPSQSMDTAWRAAAMRERYMVGVRTLYWPVVDEEKGLAGEENGYII